METRTRHVTIIDDDPDDVLLLQECLSSVLPRLEFSVIHDAQEAMDFVKKLSMDGNRMPPDLIMLDLQLPGHDGIEIAKAIRRQQTTCMIPIIAYTGLEDAQRIRDAYSAGMNCCLKKPSNLEETLRLAHGIEDFWFSTLRLPSDCDRRLSQCKTV